MRGVCDGAVSRAITQIREGGDVLVQSQNRPVYILQSVKNVPGLQIARIRSRRCIGYLVRRSLRLVLRILYCSFCILFGFFCRPLRILLHIFLHLDRLVLRVFGNTLGLLFQLVAGGLGIVRDLSGGVVDVASGVFKVVGCRHDV